MERGGVEDGQVEWSLSLAHTSLGHVSLTTCLCLWPRNVYDRVLLS